VVVASSARCGAGQLDITDVVKKDAERLKSLLRAEVVLGDTVDAYGLPSGAAIQRALATSTEDRGLLVVYSGHGQLERAGSNICVYSDDLQRGALLPATSLLRLPVSTDTASPSAPWALLILNSCESAFVDLRGAVRPTAVISTAHEEVSASLQSHAIGEKGTVLAEMLAAVLSGDDERTEEDPRAGGPDANCDGILTDFEIFGRLASALARVYPDTGSNPPVLNLRRGSRTHIPLPLDGEPLASKSCSRATVRQGIVQFISGLQAVTDEAAAELRDQLSNQIRLAQELRTSAETHHSTPLPYAKHDYFIVEPADAALEQLIENEGLARFPGGRSDAELVANYAMFTEVYLFQLDGADRVRVFSLRRAPAPYREGRPVGLRLLRNLVRSEVSVFVRGLSRRVLVIGEDDSGKLDLLVTDAVESRPLQVETRWGSVRIDTARLKLVPCEEGEGQCFAVKVDPRSLRTVRCEIGDGPCFEY
jgi:hypothetical protein